MVKEAGPEELESQGDRLILYDESVRDNFGKGYIYSVEARNEQASSGYDRTGLAIYRLKAPEFTSVKVSGDSVELTWNIVEVQGYEVQYSSDNGNTWRKAGQTDQNRISLTLEKGKKYVFRVRCQKTNTDRGTTWSSYSSWRSATIQ